MKIIRYLNKPEYIFRPRQIIRNIYWKFKKYNVAAVEVVLPWGMKIKICPSEAIGRSIWTMGLYDLSVTEVLWRLIDPGDVAIDVGANIGYMTSIMIKRVGRTGKVWCFEPHPQLYQELVENIKLWKGLFEETQIQTQMLALSDYSGEAVLEIPKDFDKNKGTASILSSNELSKHKLAIKRYTVPLIKLDEIYTGAEEIGILKIDVEGHELNVLQGANKLISESRIRDIIFEDHNGYPSSASQFLKNSGYMLFQILKGFWKPLLKPPDQKHFHPWEPPNYLATKSPLRATERLKKSGWQSLHVYKE